MKLLRFLGLGLGLVAVRPGCSFRLGASPASSVSPSRLTARFVTSGGKAHGRWNPDPALMEMLAADDTQRALEEHMNGLASGASYGPKPEDWPWGKHHWPAKLFPLVPTPVADLCGGEPGVVKFDDVSEKCATFVIQTLRCEMTCNFGAGWKGYGACMKKCAGGPPDVAWCSASANENIKKHCKHFIGRWNGCKVSSEDWATTGDWYNAIHTCVYNCETVMETEMYLGQGVPWRGAKCNPVWFACGYNEARGPIRKTSDPFKCGLIDPVLCEGPVGVGGDPCYYDSPWCGDPKWGCYPRPDEGANTSETIIHKKDGTVQTIVHVENATGGILYNMTVPRLPYIKKAPAPQWFTIVRPTPFPVEPTLPPPCIVNATFYTIINKTYEDNETNETDWELWTKPFTKLIYNGSWDGARCNPPADVYPTPGNNYSIGPLPKDFKIPKEKKPKAKKSSKKGRKKKKSLLQDASGVEGEEDGEEDEDGQGDEEAEERGGTVPHAPISAAARAPRTDEVASADEAEESHAAERLRGPRRRSLQAGLAVPPG